jgi:hypothetical protein
MDDRAQQGRSTKRIAVAAQIKLLSGRALHLRKEGDRMIHRSSSGQWGRASILATAMLVAYCLTCAAQITPPQSTSFATLSEESYSTYQMSAGNGDLWPSCWADNGNLYTANGDGNNFSSTFYSMAIGEVTGTPPNLSGSFLAGDVGYNYAGSPYTDKPTGMFCINGDIYLAYQNLNENTFNDAPAATIIESTNHGATWSANPSTPMFGTPSNPTGPQAYLFTTVFFLDFGQNNANAIDNYVYVYGLDNNWRSQTALYLARVPNTSILNRSSWQFFAGMNGSTPIWNSDITKKVAVMTDQRELYASMFGTDCPAYQTVVAQGGVTYDKPLNRYIFASWGCATHEFYDAPQPWGPWSHTASKDFGPLRLIQNRGQYGTSIPSKFISSDGKTLYLQSNVCCSGDSYTYSLRKIVLAPYTGAAATNTPSDTNLATSPSTVAISKSTHYGSLCGSNCSDQLNSGVLTVSEDDWDEENKPTDAVQSYWGYTWLQQYNMNQVVFQTGNVFSDGGWFSSGLSVQVRQDFQWVNAPITSITPAYPYSSAAGAQTEYTINFSTVAGDGVRVIGTPGGSDYFTSVTQLSVYDRGASPNMVLDPGFELQRTNTVSSPWSIEGADQHGIDRGLGFAHSGNNDAWIRDSTSNWNAITQKIAVTPNTDYVLTGWVQNNFTTNSGYFGVRKSDGVTVLQQTSFTAAPGYTQLFVPFNSGSNSTVTVFCGFWGIGSDQWLRMDDFMIE